MASPTTDRRLGLTGGAAMKVPCAVATTANITLSGEQTIDGQLTSASRVLVMNQTDQTTNGIYVSDSGTWSRDLDFDGAKDAVTGTMVFVINGTAGGNKFYQCTTTGTITIGTSSITFSAVSVAFSGLTANSVATSNIQASAVTYAKIQNAAAGNVLLGNATSAAAAFAEIAVAQNTLVGRGSTGNIVGITLGSGLSFAAGVLSAATSLVGSQHRVTLTTALPVTTSDVTAAATVYMTPYNGTAVNVGGVSYSTTQLSLALDSNAAHTGYHQSGKNFDLFAYISSGSTVAIGTGPAWTSDTARGTGAGTTEITQTNGVWVNKNTITLRIGTNSGDTASVTGGNATYIATFRTTADGQTEDSAVKRFVWNNYNRVVRQMLRIEATDSWTYTTATIRQANGAAANQLDFVVGLQENAVTARIFTSFANTSATVGVAIGIGLDVTNAFSSGTLSGVAVSPAVNTDQQIDAVYSGVPGVGRHFLSWNEQSTATGTTTWFGDNGGVLWQSGISGEFLA